MVLTPQMAISHLVMTIGVGISQKKNIKNFDHVQILWNDPYIFLCQEELIFQGYFLAKLMTGDPHFCFVIQSSSP